MSEPGTYVNVDDHPLQNEMGGRIHRHKPQITKWSLVACKAEARLQTSQVGNLVATRDPLRENPALPTKT